MELTKSKYKQTEVGLIPEDWTLMKLEDIIDQSRHIRYGVVQPGKYTQNGCLMLRSQDYSKGWKSIETMHRVNQVIESLYKGTKLKQGDLVITIVGAGIAQVVEVPKKIEGTLLSRSTARIAVNKEKAVSKLILHFLTNSLGREQVLFGIKEGAQPVVSANDVGNCLIPLPPTLTEQKAIATALSDVDDLITNLDKLITKKKAIKQGAMQQLLTPPHKGGKRLAGFTGEWVECELQSLCDVIGGGTPSTTVSEYWNGGINWFTPTEIGLNKFVANSKRKISALGLKSSSAQYLPKGTILLTTRASIGDVAILQKKGCTNQGFQSLIPKESHDSEFLYQLILTKRNDLMSLSSGSTFLEISPKKVKSLKVCVPKSINERNAIAHVLLDLDKEIEKLKSKRAKYQDIKQGMMQELLTGKTRLV